MIAWLKEKHKEAGFPPVDAGSESKEELQAELEKLTSYKKVLEAKIGQ